MRKKLFLLAGIGWISMLFLTSCEKFPSMFTVNNLRMVMEDSTIPSYLNFLPVQGIEGTWYWQEHRIVVVHDSIFSSDPKNSTITNHPDFKAMVIDTVGDKAGNVDTSYYRMSFMTVYGHPFIEIYSYNLNHSDHDFRVALYSHLNILKMVKDTLIIQMPDSQKLEAYVKSKKYGYFIPYGTDKEEWFPLYITENPNRLAKLLKEIAQNPKLMQVQDTLIKK